MSWRTAGGAHSASLLRAITRGCRVFTVALQPDHVHAALAQRLELPGGGGAGVLTALGGGVTVLVFLALRATFAAVAVLLEPVFALVRLLLKLVVVFAVVVALVVLVGLGKLGGRGRRAGAARHAGRRSPDELTSPCPAARGTGSPVEISSDTGDRLISLRSLEQFQDIQWTRFVSDFPGAPDVARIVMEFRGKIATLIDHSQYSRHGGRDGSE
jgi:hypothetical protein